VLAKQRSFPVSRTAGLLFSLSGFCEGSAAKVGRTSGFRALDNRGGPRSNIVWADPGCDAEARMAEGVTNVLRAELLAVLSANTGRLLEAMRDELARPIALEGGRRLQFEVDPFGFGVFSCATEEALLSGNWLEDALPGDWFERAEAALGGWTELISAELCPWFAECWQAVAGPARFSPAFLFFHGYHREQFDLERLRWLPAAEAFGG
jgi:hypothetical protein